MAEVRATAQKSVAAPVEKVFALVADTSRRRELLPAAYVDVRVVGDPPVVSYTLHAGGRERDYAMRQLPADDLRSFTEEDEGSSLVTRWNFTPATAGETTVAITTTWQGAGGIGGFFEKTFAPKGVSKLHTQTLENLARVLAH
jgi:ribosome-associated toxin RatA of RatAB toxin-antitoxin module